MKLTEQIALNSQELAQIMLNISNEGQIASRVLKSLGRNDWGRFWTI